MVQIQLIRTPESDPLYCECGGLILGDRPYIYNKRTGTVQCWACGAEFDILLLSAADHIGGKMVWESNEMAV